MLIKQAALRGFFRFLWRMVKLRDWLLLHTTGLVLWCAPLLLFGTVLMFHLHQHGMILLPDFIALNSTQTRWVMLILLLQGLVHLLLLLHRSDSLKLRVWHAFLLGISGLSLAAVGGGFVVHYPPFHWLMVFFPALGFLLAWAGFDINKRARFELEQEKKGRDA